MIAKLVASVALGATLALGAAGAVGATGVPGASGAAGGHVGVAAGSHSKVCAKAPAELARADRGEANYHPWLKREEKKEAAAKKAGRTKRVAKIEERIDGQKAAYRKAVAAAKKLQSECPGVKAA